MAAAFSTAPAHDPIGGGEVLLGAIGAQELHPLDRPCSPAWSGSAGSPSPRRQGQTDAGVPRGRLDDHRAPGRESPWRSPASTIASAVRSLTEPPGLRLLALAEDLGRAGAGEPPQAHERRVPDPAEDVVVDGWDTHQMKYIVAGATGAPHAGGLRPRDEVAQRGVLEHVDEAPPPPSPQTSDGTSSVVDAALPRRPSTPQQHLRAAPRNGAQHVGHRDLGRAGARARSHRAGRAVFRPAPRAAGPWRICSRKRSGIFCAAAISLGLRRLPEAMKREV